MRVPYSVEVRSIPATVLDFVGAKSQEAFTGASLAPFIKEAEKEDRLALSLTIHKRDELLSTIEKSYESLKQEPGVTSLPDRHEPLTGTGHVSERRGNGEAMQKFDKSIS